MSATRSKGRPETKAKAKRASDAHEGQAKTASDHARPVVTTHVTVPGLNAGSAIGAVEPQTGVSAAPDVSQEASVPSVAASTMSGPTREPQMTAGADSRQNEVSLSDDLTGGDQAEHTSQLAQATVETPESEPTGKAGPATHGAEETPHHKDTDTAKQVHLSAQPVPQPVSVGAASGTAVFAATKRPVQTPGQKVVSRPGRSGRQSHATLAGASSEPEAVGPGAEQATIQQPTMPSDLTSKTDADGTSAAVLLNASASPAKPSSSDPDGAKEKPSTALVVEGSSAPAVSAGAGTAPTAEVTSVKEWRPETATVQPGARESASRLFEGMSMAGANRALDRTLRSDLRIGLRTEAFGEVRIDTSLQHGQLSAVLGLADASQSSTLQAHLPQAEQTIAHNLGLDASIQLGQASVSSGDQSSGRQGQNQNLPGRNEGRGRTSANTSVRSLQEIAGVSARVYGHARERHWIRWSATGRPGVDITV